jgi:hypothetical protein
MMACAHEIARPTVRSIESAKKRSIDFGIQTLLEIRGLITKIEATWRFLYKSLIDKDNASMFGLTLAKNDRSFWCVATKQ